jgi:hypothetical protein
MLAIHGTTAEYQPLHLWLVINDTISMSLNSDANKTHLRQRFALMTFGFQPMTSILVFQIIKWNFVGSHQ